VRAERDEHAIGHRTDDGGAARDELLLRLRAGDDGEEQSG
jgi:hypothetical protein